MILIDPHLFISFSLSLSQRLDAHLAASAVPPPPPDPAAADGDGLEGLVANLGGYFDGGRREQ
jgi:hypothetical protein